MREEYSFLKDGGALILRAWLGINLAFAHGLGKISDIEGFLANPALQKFPYPEPMGWFAALAELAGGILLAVGLASRFAAAAIMGTMLGAGVIVHAADPWKVKELALTYAIIALFCALNGPGKISLDHLLFGRRKAGPALEPTPE